jgi:hypothetical protein
VVKVNFLDFQANIFSLLYKPKGGKFFFVGVLDKAVLM